MACAEVPVIVGCAQSRSNSEGVAQYGRSKPEEYGSGEAQGRRRPFWGYAGIVTSDRVAEQATRSECVVVRESMPQREGG